MIVIPAIDIIDGKCVRLTQGDFAATTVYSHDPLAVAKTFEDAGLSHLHLVDLDGAKSGVVINWKVIESIAAGTSLAVDFGGGVKTLADIRRLLDAGIQQVNIGSVAVKDPSLVGEWIAQCGQERIILSADVKAEMIQAHGWQQSSAVSVLDFIGDYQRRGIQYVTCTDIAVDGTLSGPNLALYKKIHEMFPTVLLTASGGISTMDDLVKLEQAGLHGAIVGKAIYENKIPLAELASYRKK